MSLRCRLGLHDFRWPPHWQVEPGATLYFRLTLAAECQRGCGARRVMECDPRRHFEDHHPERKGEDET